MKNIFFLTLFLPTLLLPASSSVSQKTQALFGAISKSNAQKAQSLLDGRADVNAVDKFSLLDRTIPAGSIDIIRLLVENKASVNAQQNLLLQTPLSTAITYSNIEAIKLLLLNKAVADDENITNAWFNWHNTSNGTELKKKRLDTFNLLIEFGYVGGGGSSRKLSQQRTKDIDNNPLPPAILTYRKQQFVPTIQRYIPVQVVANLTAGYLSNYDLVVSYNQTRADETVAARDRRFNERKAILFMADRSSYKPSCVIS